VVAALTDAWVPAVFSRAEVPTGVPTVDLTIHFRNQPPQRPGWCLVRFGEHHGDAGSFAAAMTSSSRTEPPGWITAVHPASMAASRPSRNGKNASLAQTPPAARPSAFCAARMPASRRFCCPAPMPRPGGP
jgi:hypothetical protein